MEHNNPSVHIKDLNFGDEAKNKVILGVEKLAKAVKSTLGASGKCVIYEDAMGKPVITKDGVTVAESVVLFDPVENMGATMIKEAAQNTVREAGDGTTTATVLAESLLQEVYKNKDKESIREIKTGLTTGLNKVNEYLKSVSVEVKGDMLKDVGTISCNNEKVLGEIIADAYEKVGSGGVVLMEGSGTEETYVEVVNGVQLTCGLTSPHFITDKEKNKSELEKPLVLLCASEIPNVRKIQKVLEHVIKTNRSLLVVSKVSSQVMSALMMNNMKGTIKVNIIEPPGFGPTRAEAIDDLAMLTGATIINEDLGDDLDLVSLDHLGEAEKSVTSDKTTVLTLDNNIDQAAYDARLLEVAKKISTEKNAFIKKKLEERLATLSGSVAVIKVGANSQIELKEKRDRIEDAIYATKAAIKEGIVPGGGVALLNASQNISPTNVGEKILLQAIRSPFYTILDNAGITLIEGYEDHEGYGIDVITGERATMVSAGIIDPVLVTKSALKNAVSVVSTIISADCVISNMRSDESN